MADYIVKDTELTSVANAIRTAGGTNSLLNFPNGFVSAVNNINGGESGSSDFTTVKMKLEGVQGVIQYSFPILTENGGVTYTAGIFQELETNNEVDILLPIGGGAVGDIRNVGDFDITYSGNIQNIVEDRFIITGDCTITLSESPT